jgi:chromosome segregation ATPase
MSDHADLDSRLRAAITRRDNVANTVKRIEGRLEAAKQALSEAEKECRDRNIDPNNIEQHLSNLEGRYADAVATLERDVSAAEIATQPFIKEIV